MKLKCFNIIKINYFIIIIITIIIIRIGFSWEFSLRSNTAVNSIYLL